MGGTKGTAVALLLISVLALPAGAMTQTNSVSITAEVAGTPQNPPRGGGGAVSRATVVFSGRAYPESVVTVLQDGAVRDTALTRADGAFSLALENVSGGHHTFTLYATDRNGIRSAPASFPLTVPRNLITTVSGILMAPTLASDRQGVGRGDVLTFYGHAVPGSEVTVTVTPGVKAFPATGDPRGSYLYPLLTDILPRGSYRALARAALEGRTSTSSPVRFTIGEATEEVGCAYGDANCDGRVDLIDFALLSFWFRKQDPAARADLNADGRVDLTDFSIMAYGWTG